MLITAQEAQKLVHESDALLQRILERISTHIQKRAGAGEFHLILEDALGDMSDIFKLSYEKPHPKYAILVKRVTTVLEDAGYRVGISSIDFIDSDLPQASRGKRLVVQW